MLEASIYLFFSTRIAIYDRLWHVVPNRELTIFALCEFKFLRFSPYSIIAAMSVFLLGLTFAEYIGGGDTKLICLLSFLVPNLNSLILVIYLALFLGTFEIFIAKLQKRQNIGRIAFAPWILVGGLFGFCLSL